MLFSLLPDVSQNWIQSWAHALYNDCEGSISIGMPTASLSHLHVVEPPTFDGTRILRDYNEAILQLGGRQALHHKSYLGVLRVLHGSKDLEGWEVLL